MKKSLFIFLGCLCGMGSTACSNPFPTDPSVYTLTYDSIGDHLFIEFTAEKVPDLDDGKNSLTYDDIKEMSDIWAEPVGEKDVILNTTCILVSEQERKAKCIVDFPDKTLPKCDPSTLVISAKQKSTAKDRNGTKEEVSVVSTPELDVTTATPAQGETLMCLTKTTVTDGDRDGDKILDSKDQCPDTEETRILSTLEPVDGVADGCSTITSDQSKDQVVTDEGMKDLPILKASGSGCALVETGGPVSLWPLAPLFVAFGFRNRRSITGGKKS